VSGMAGSKVSETGTVRSGRPLAVPRIGRTPGGRGPPTMPLPTPFHDQDPR